MNNKIYSKKFNFLKKYLGLGLLFLFILISCKKEHKEDYRNNFAGKYEFTVINESWTISEPTKYDTSSYEGTISLFSKGDELIDLSVGSDSQNNSDKRITISFILYGIITPVVNEDGGFIPESGYHYYNTGQILNNNTIDFVVRGLGGLGGGNNYTVHGIKK